ncbi:MULTISPECIES: hypothetical protein [Brevibacillus]|jgi:hypothetical protein|uniref:DUF2158 domain-containing protein n=1 Tax=Brevibacillus aydinogluensis TaxID=927786 RepID=A0AA48M906_9BACL|nr:MULTISPECIES: hypothetical protein [Brevibacillus]MBR8660852.1 hypothetical protein [Brevibacillus sp. NL20B1]MDT3414284.1 hypothetical protein [Brevibacillus aydinogluensis]CAJ1003498.1 DUF2158 domain-containing protein [Brevibacillus aydinogluensis]
MFKPGECVVYTRDGARGIVIAVNGEWYQIFWEDTFVSWEKAEVLTKAEQLS